ncbi:MAG TPA: hypothetical protein VJB09_02650 [Candidatus Paceibacterota bacterium]
MKQLAFLLCFLSFCFLCCSPEEKNKELIQQNKVLKEKNTELAETKGSLSAEVESLTEQKNSLTESIIAKEKELSIYQEGRAPVYIVKFEVTLRKNLELLAYHSDFELPVSKEFFDAAEIGKNTSDLSGYKTLTIAIVWGDCKVVGKRIE